MKSLGSGHVEEWQRVHAELTRLARCRAELESHLGRCLLTAARSAVHVRLGMASFAEYVERTLGEKPRWTEERLRVARCLESLPALDSALEAGSLPWSTVRELTRVTTAGTEAEWLEFARDKTVRDVERAVRGRQLGDRPRDPANPELIEHILRFEVRAKTLALWRDLVARIKTDAGEELDDDAVLAAVARAALGGPADAGRASYQIALNVCQRCEVGYLEAQGEQVVVSSDFVEAATCDAQHIGSVSPHVGAQARASQCIPPSMRRAILRRDGGRCVVPGCRNTRFLDVHHLDRWAERREHDPDRMVCLCGAHHRAEHRGTLSITGTVSGGLRFEHADGTPYGQPPRPARAEGFAKVFVALKGMGFKEGESRRALERVRPHVGAEPTLETLLRAALGELGPSRGRA